MNKRFIFGKKKRKSYTREWAYNTVGSTRGGLADRVKSLDGYNTPAIAVEKLLKVERFSKHIWEPANGNHFISAVLEQNGHKVFTSDIYRWSKKTKQVKDFHDFKQLPSDKSDIITNPPFIQAERFVRTSMRLLKPGGKLALLLRLQFLEGQKRQKLFNQFPPARIHVFSQRLPRMHKFNHTGKESTSVLAFAWFVFVKGNTNPPVIYWI